MKTPKPKVATKKQLLESIASLQADLQRAREQEQAERNARYADQQKVKKAEASVRDLEFQLAGANTRVRQLELDLVDARARIEVYEFLARMQHGVKELTSSSDGRPTKFEPRGLDASVYEAYRSQR